MYEYNLINEHTATKTSAVTFFRPLRVLNFVKTTAQDWDLVAG